MDLGKHNSNNFTQAEIYADVSPNVLAFITIIGLMLMLMNGLVICCGILYRAKLNNAYSMHILSLSVSDFIVGGTVIPTMMTLMMAGKDSVPCVACFAVSISTQCASLCHILGICLHRVFIVMFKTSPGPVRSSHKKVAACICLTWLICPAVASIPFVVLVQPEPLYEQCSLNAIFGDNYDQAIGAIAGILLAPLLLTDGCYALFICYLKHLRHRIVPNVTSDLAHTTRTTQADRVRSDTNMREEDRLSNLAEDASSRPPSQPKADDLLNRGGEGQREASNSDCPVASTSTGLTDSAQTTRISPQTLLSVNAGQDPKRCPPVTPNVNTSAVGHLPRTTTHATPAQTTAITTIGILLLILNVCSLPLLFTFLVESLVDGIRFSRNAKVLQLSLMLLNVGLNPVVYTVKMRAFRTCLVDMFKKFARRLRRIFECCLN